MMLHMIIDRTCPEECVNMYSLGSGHMFNRAAAHERSQKLISKSLSLSNMCTEFQASSLSILWFYFDFDAKQLHTLSLNTF